MTDATAAVSPLRRRMIDDMSQSLLIAIVANMPLRLQGDDQSDLAFPLNTFFKSRRRPLKAAITPPNSKSAGQVFTSISVVKRRHRTRGPSGADR